MRLLLALFIGIYSSLNITLSSQTIADALPGCLGIVDQVGIGCGGGSSIFAINGLGQFEVSNIDGVICCASGGDWNSYFEFDEIDISCFADVSILFDYSASLDGAGDSFEDDSTTPLFGCTNTLIDNSHDQIVFFYSLDGGPFIQSLYVHGTTVADFTGTWTVGGLNGNTLSIRVYASNKAGHEHFYFENLVISSTLGALDAGPPETFCNIDPVNLQATGSGTWSGGAGTFSDINDPNGIYTPDPSEDNTTVTLTYTGCSAGGACGTSYPGTIDMVDYTFSALSADPVTIDGCSNSLTMYDLTQHNTTVNPTENVTWYDGDPDAGGILITPDNNVDLNTIGDLWAQVDNGATCTAAVDIIVNIAPSPTVSLLGDIDICQGECSDPASSLEFVFAGGTAPYTLELSLQVTGFPALNIPGLGINVGENIIICSDGFIPGFSTSPNTITIPELLVGSFTMTLISAVDADGCPATIGTNQISITVNPTPSAVDPNIPDGCAQTFLNFDLTAFNTTVNPTGTVMWYDGNPETAGTLITNPSSVDLTTISDLWVLVTEGTNGCTVTLDIAEPTIIDGPEIFFDGGGPFDLCLGECETITYTILNGTAPYIVNFTSSATFGGSLDNYSFDLNLNAGENMITLCLQGAGNMQSHDDGLNTFYITDGALPAGFSELQINSISDANGCAGTVSTPDLATFTFSGGPPAVDAMLEECDLDNDGFATFDLTQLNETINGNTGLAVNYFTDFAATMSIGSPASYIAATSTVYAQVVDGACVSNIAMISLLTLESIVFIAPADITVCSEYEFSVINSSGATPLGPIYSDGPLGSGNTFMAGAFIMTSGTYYIYDPSFGACQNNPSFNITIDPLLTAGANVETAVCEGVDVDLNTLLDGADGGGFYLDASGAPVSNVVVTTGLSGTSLIFTYNVDNLAPCPDDSAEITINITSGVSAGMDNTGQVCTGNTIDLTTVLTSDASLGGTFNDDNMTGGLIANIFDAVATAPGFYDFTYTIGGGSCTVETSVMTIEVLPGPIVDNAFSAEVCDLYTLPTITGSNLSGNETYYTMPDAMGTEVLAGSDITMTTNLYVYDTNMACVVDELIIITVNPTPDAGKDSTIFVCEGYSQLLDFTSLLDLGTDLTGSWSESSTTAVDITDITTVDIATVSGQNINLQYELANGLCTDIADINIIWISDPTVGMDAIVSACNNDDDYNLDMQIGPHSPLGIWTQTSGPMIDFADSSSLDLTVLTPDVYEFQYIITATGYCQEFSSSVSLTVLESPFAGMDIMASACDGSVIDLFSYIDGDLTGTFVNTMTSLPVPSGMYDTAGENGTTVTFQYTVATVGGACPDDISMVDIMVVNTVSAGDAIPNNTVCEGEELNLNTVLTGADPGGTFAIIAGQGTLVGNIYTAPFSPTSDLVTFEYTVGDGVVCPIDTETIDVTILTSPILTLSPLDNAICPESCANFSVAFQATPPLQYTLTFSSDDGQSTMLTLNAVTPTQSLQICNNGGILQLGGGIGDLGMATGMWQVEATSITDANCSIQGTTEMFNFDPNGGLILQDIDPTLCPGGSVVINGELYDINNPSGSELVMGTNGCDTLFAIELDFNPLTPGEINGFYCSDASIVVGTDIFDINNPSGTASLIGQAQGGCDSMVMVDMQFYPVEVGNMIGVYCTDDEVIVGNVIFDIDNPSGMVSLLGLAQGGCDSTVMVNLTFVNETFNNINTTECQDYEITLNNTIYNSANPVGQDTIFDGNSQGCDSIINVTLDFYPQSSMDIAPILCTGEDITVNGIVYNENNLMGQETLVGMSMNGCDSVVNINLTYEELPVDITSTTIVQNQSVQLSLDIMGAYNTITWTPSSGLSCDDCVDPIASPIITTLYTATVDYGIACSVDVSIEVLIEETIEQVYIPNVFSPNGDGNNDKFVIFPSDPNILIASLKIYDRWGELVFFAAQGEFSNTDMQWDGTFKGDDLSPGVYVYVLETASLGAETSEVFTGDITLIR